MNITHKQLRQKYYPEKKLSTLKNDKKKFYKTLIDKGMTDIISIDETGFYLNMSKNFGRCSKGKRCYRTVNIYPYVKFNFICAIKYGKVIGYELYPTQSGGIDALAFNNFYNKYIKNKYENHLIILDNARFHKSVDVINNINTSKNKVIFSLPYNPQLNPIENFFSQLKNHFKNESPINYEDLKKEIKNVIENKISKDHLKKYFKYLFLQANEYMKK
jgi:transposase